MRPIKLYFAGAPLKCEAEGGVRNRLLSYAYPTDLEKWFEISKGKNGNIIVDSGAFSAWNKSSMVNLNDYIKYCHAACKKSENKKMRFVNLDVIPGKVGGSSDLIKIRKPENIELISKASKEGLDNLLEMKKNGITPIHVFHQGEDWKWLDKMLEHTDYIGISPANDMSVKSRREWIESVFDYLYKNSCPHKTHGFAVWMRGVLRQYPWESCDATSWKMSAGRGRIFYPVGGFTNPDYSQPPLMLIVSEKTGTEGLKDLTRGKLEFLHRDGYSLSDLQVSKIRYLINIYYFLGLEKWLNQQRKGKQYTPKNRLL